MKSRKMDHTFEDSGFVDSLAKPKSYKASQKNKLPDVPRSESRKNTEMYDDGEGDDRGFQSLVQESASDEGIMASDEGIMSTKMDIEDITGFPYADHSENQNAPQGLDALCGELPCCIFFINKTMEKLQTFKTFDELSEYLVLAATNEKPNTDEDSEYISKMLKFPLRQIDHYTTIGEYLRDLYESDTFMDVHVEVDGKVFMAHRIALCCYSQYFSDLFCNSKRKRVPYIVHLTGICAEAFASFLEFIYTGEVTIYPETAGDILLIADFLKVKRLQQKRGVIVEQLSIQQVVKIIGKSKLSTATMTTTVFARLLSQFSSAAETEEFMSIDVDTLCLLLESDDLVVENEYAVFQVVHKWIVHNAEDSLAHTSRLFKLIRFPYMTPEELFMCVEQCQLKGDNQFREIIIANWLVTAQRLKRNDPFHFPTADPRRCYTSAHADNTAVTKTTTGTVPMPPPLMTSTPKPSPKTAIDPQTVDILVVGGFQVDSNTSANNRFIERYDAEDNQWVHFCKLPEPRCHHAVTTLFGKMYLIGGSNPACDVDGPTPTSSVYLMDVVTKKWTAVADMNEARLSHCSCAVNGKIYAIGGKGFCGSALSTVECYDPKTDRWSYVASMETPRFAATAASIGSTLYVAGGISGNDDSVLDTVECYEPVINRWTRKHNLRFPRCNASLVNVDGRLFLCGGATQPKENKDAKPVSVTAIDEYIDKVDVWCHRTDMAIPRHDAGVAVAGSRLYMIGGVSSSDDRVLQSIECYDNGSSTWLSGVQDLPYPARWICCTSVASKWNRSCQQPERIRKNK